MRRLSDTSGGSLDLLLVLLGSLLAALLALADGPLALRLPLGLLAVLILPGYSLVAVLFPRFEGFDAVERFALAFGVSLALLALVVLGLNASPWGLHPRSIVLAVTATTLLLLTLAGLRRRLASVGPAPPAPLGGLWRTATAPARLALVALAGALLVATAVLALGLARPEPPLTEFYLLGPAGLATDYPTVAKPGEPVTVWVGIGNREGAASRYRIVILANGEPLAADGPFDVAAGQTVEQRLSFALARPGQDQRVELVLYRNDDPSAYRALQIWLDTSPPTPARASSAVARAVETARH